MEEKETNNEKIFESEPCNSDGSANTEKNDHSADSAEKKGFFRPTQNGWTLCIYVFGVALFYVLCVMLGLNIHVVPKFFSNLISILSPLIYGFVIAFVLTPAVRFFENKVLAKWNTNHQGLKHILCIAIAYILVLALVFLFVMFLIPQITATYNQFSSQLSVNIVTIRNSIADILDNSPFGNDSNSYMYYNISSDYRKELTDFVLADSLNNPWGLAVKMKNTATQDEVQQIIDEIGDKILQAVTDSLPVIFTSAINFLLEAKNFIIGIIVSIYLLISKNSIIGTFNRLAHTWLPLRMYRRCAWMVNKAKNIFRDYIIVRLFDSVIVGGISLIGLLLVRNEYAYLLAVIIALSALIPFIGPVIGIVICSVMIMLLGFEYALGFAIVMITVQILDDRIIEPLLTHGHSQHRLAGIWIFSAIIVMSGFFGFFGLLFGIPLFAFIYSLVKDIAEKHLRRKGMDVDTESYGYTPFTPKKKRTVPDTEKSTVGDTDS